MITLVCANTGGEGNFRLMGVNRSDGPQELQVNISFMFNEKDKISVHVVYELAAR